MTYPYLTYYCTICHHYQEIDNYFLSLNCFETHCFYFQFRPILHISKNFMVISLQNLESWSFFVGPSQDDIQSKHSISGKYLQRIYLDTDLSCSEWLISLLTDDYSLSANVLFYSLKLQKETYFKMFKIVCLNHLYSYRTFVHIISL